MESDEESIDNGATLKELVIEVFEHQRELGVHVLHNKRILELLIANGFKSGNKTPHSAIAALFSVDTRRGLDSTFVAVCKLGPNLPTMFALRKNMDKEKIRQFLKITYPKQEVQDYLDSSVATPSKIKLNNSKNKTPQKKKKSRKKKKKKNIKLLLKQRVQPLQ